MTKPVRGAELRACIERVLERQLEAITGRHQKLVTRTTLATEQGQGQFHGRVLVVEDNVVNQQVARRFLQRLGCEALVAENGKRGVEEYFKGEYGLVLDGRADARDGRLVGRPREIRSSRVAQRSACRSLR